MRSSCPALAHGVGCWEWTGEIDPHVFFRALNSGVLHLPASHALSSLAFRGATCMPSCAFL